jgi:hypothetical protein
LHNGVAILGILSAYAAKVGSGEGFGGFEGLRHPEEPETL